MKKTDKQLLALVDRMHRACLTVATFAPAGPRGFFSTWPAYKLDWFDWEDFGDARTDESVTRRLIRPPRFVPTAKEIDDALPCLALLDGDTITRQQRKIIRLRALQRWYGKHARPGEEDFEHWRGAWRRIAQLANCSHTTAQKLHFDAMRYALIVSLNRNSAGAEALPKSSR